MRKFQLSVGTVTKRLVEYQEVCRIAPFNCDKELKNDFETHSNDVSNVELLRLLKEKFPEVFDESMRSHNIKHSIVATVDTTTFVFAD